MGFKREDVKAESRYLSGEDTKKAGGFIDGTVAYALREEVGEERREKLVVYFSTAIGANKQPVAPMKAMIVNMTNANVLFDRLGEDSDQWVGGRVRIWWDPAVQFRGKTIGGLRFKDAKPTVQPLPPKGASSDDLNDEIPF